MKIYKLAVIVIAAFIFAACQPAANNQPLSPTETMKALNDAAKKKDAEAIKKLISQGTLDLLEQSAKQQNTSVDELLKRDEGAPFQELPETRNEKIAGDTATIEIKNNAINDWETMPFIKENGVWKIALDQFLDAAMKRMNEEMKEIPVNSPPANGTEKPKTKGTAANK
jgi:hypothetical protein